MNEQQREALEGVQKFFPRGLVSFTITPRDGLHAMLLHPAIPDDNTEVDLDPEKEPDAYHLDLLVQHTIKFWEDGE